MPVAIPLDAPAPDEAHLRIAAHCPTTFLLESRDGPARLARHSIVGWDPAATVFLDAAGGLRVSGQAPQPKAGEGLLDYLRRAAPLHPTAGPLSASVVGLAGYALAHAFEPVLERALGKGAAGPESREEPRKEPREESKPGPEPVPRFAAGIYHDLLVYDHAAGTATYRGIGPDRSAALRKMLAKPAPAPSLRVGPVQTPVDDATFAQRVRAAQQAIRAGEAFQVVLSRPFEADYEGDVAACYARLRELERVPYLYHLRFGGPGGTWEALGASPEMLVRVQSGKAETFPIAGTRPASGDAAEDARRAASLRADRKENAEHAMLVDLARNDLARVCLPGTVRVASYARVEPFRAVMHLVSHVEGRLAPGRDALDAFRAVFPAGTVSGAPKLRAMEHIAAIERRPRGAYAGAVLHLDSNGDLDSCIAIRGLTARAGRLIVQAGAGVVLGSDPDAEAQESRHKASTVLEALAAFAAQEAVPR